MSDTILALLGFATVITVIVLLLRNVTVPALAFVSVSTITAAILVATGAFTLDEMAGFIKEGVKGVHGTAILFIFSVLFFGVMTDAGMFDKIIGALMKKVGNNVVGVALMTCLIAIIGHLDGGGASTFLITIPAMLPVYKRLHMRRETLLLICVTSMGVMNLLPWGGPTIRAATALGMGDNPVAFFLPVLPAVLVGLVCVLVISAFLGAGEKKRIGAVALQAAGNTEQELTEEQKALLRPHLFWVNIILIVAAIVSLLFSGFAPAVVFMAFYVLATVINYPSVKDSKARVDAHAKEALMMCSVLFAAGCFTGIMQGTGMITEMASTLVSIIPHTMGKFFPLIIGIIGMPASLLFDPDSFYYGVLPVLAQTAEGFGVAGVDVGRAAILGQMTIGFPVSPLTASTFLLVGLSGVDFGEHQKKTIPLAWLVSLVMVVVAILTRGIAI